MFTMKRILPILLDTLHALALALWFGLAAGLLVMARPGAPDATLTLFIQRAGGLIEAAGMTMVGVQFLLRRRYARHPQLAAADAGRQFLTLGALILAELGRYSLLRSAASVTPHQFSVLCQLAGAQLCVLTGVTALTCWLFVPRAQSAPIAPPTPMPAVPPITPLPNRPSQPKPAGQRKRK